MNSRDIRLKVLARGQRKYSVLILKLNFSINSVFLSLKYGEGSSLTGDHITELISCLGDNIRSPNRKQLTSGLLDLRSKLLAATIPLNSLQAVLFSFQDAVVNLRDFPVDLSLFD